MARDVSNRGCPDWAIIQEADGYWVVPVRDRLINTVRVLHLEGVPAYGPYSLTQAQVKYEEMGPATWAMLPGDK